MISSTFRFITSVSLVSIFLVLPFSNSEHLQAQTPENGLRSDYIDAMQPKNVSSTYYNEFWTYHIKLDNGVQILYGITISDFGSYKERITGIKYQFTWTDSSNYVLRKEYALDTFSYDSTSNTLEVHPDRVYGMTGKFDSVHTLSFKLRRDGNEYYSNIELYDIAPSQTWGSGNFYKQGKQIGLTFPIPHAKVRGTIALNGDTLRNISGVAYMDHVHHTDLGSKLFKVGYRFKSGDDENGIVGNIIETKKNGELIGYAIRYENGNPTLLKPVLVVSKNHTNLRNTKIDSNPTFTFHDGSTYQFKIEHIQNDDSILDALGGFSKFFAKRVLGGEVIQYHGYGKDGDENEVYFHNFIID